MVRKASLILGISDSSDIRARGTIQEGRAPAHFRAIGFPYEQHRPQRNGSLPSSNNSGAAYPSEWSIALVLTRMRVQTYTP